MTHTYQTRGVCSRSITIDIDPETHTIHSVAFAGGCMGNTQGIAQLVRGMRAEEVIPRLKGIACGTKRSSCPDQLATALEEIIGK